MFREKKQFSFLMPAILTATLVFNMLPQTQVALREIPEKLQLVAEVEAKEPVTRKAADHGNQEVIPAGEGNYEDGVYTGSSRGYGGDITVEVTVENRQIIDIRILSAPGETDPYYSLATTLLDTVKQSQTWEVDTVSGATYSSRGILGAIQNALTGETVENEAPPSNDPVGTTTQDAFKDPSAYKDGTYFGTANGFGGPIRVEVVIKDGKIASIRIVSAPGETGDYLGRAKGVLSRILSKGSPNVDAVSGATYSSTGIINAVKRALNQAVLDGEEIPAADHEIVTPLKPGLVAEKQNDFEDPSEYEDGVWRGKADGFGGEIEVEVTIKEGKIEKISIVSASGETQEYFEKAQGVIPEILKAGSPNVDAVSGATFSSTGIIDAVKNALRQASKDPAEEDPIDDPGEDPGDDPTDDPDDEVTYEDGTYTGSGWCDDGYEFYYQINVSIRVTDGKITTVSVTKGEDQSDYPEDNDFYLNWAIGGRTRSGTFYPGVPAQIVSKQSAEVDTISGATYSSTTIRSIAAEIISSIPVAETHVENAVQTDGNTPGLAVLPTLVMPSSPDSGKAAECSKAAEKEDESADEELNTEADSEEDPEEAVPDKEQGTESEPDKEQGTEQDTVSEPDKRQDTEAVPAPAGNAEADRSDDRNAESEPETEEDAEPQPAAAEKSPEEPETASEEKDDKAEEAVKKEKTDAAPAKEEMADEERAAKETGGN